MPDDDLIKILELLRLSNEAIRIGIEIPTLFGTDTSNLSTPLEYSEEILRILSEYSKGRISIGRAITLIEMILQQR